MKWIKCKNDTEKVQAIKKYCELPELEEKAEKLYGRYREEYYNEY